MRNYLYIENSKRRYIELEREEIAKSKNDFVDHKNHRMRVGEIEIRD